MTIKQPAVRGAKPAEIKLLLEKERKKKAKIDQKINDLISQCTHEGFLLDKQKYHEGGYDYTAWTDYWTECAVCGAKSSISRESHGWYG